MWTDRKGYDVSPAALEAERAVFTAYGDTVSVAKKAKALNKFGLNSAVGNSWETVAQFQGTTANETYVSTNKIDAASCASAASTGLVLTLEGHTIDGSGNLTFVSQDVTLDGTNSQTPVALTTPMARANRLYVKASGTFTSPQAAPAGTVYIYDNTDGATAGVPTTASATKIVLENGESQSLKCATSVSSLDYWFLEYFSASIGAAGASANLVDVRIESRDVVNGGVWRPLGRDIILLPGQLGVTIYFNPYYIVPKSHDVRVRAQTDTNTASIYAEIGGPLAAIV